MVKVAVIGAGKMGISHISILGAHPKVQVVGVCDSSKMVTDMLAKYSPFACFSDYKTMIRTVQPDAVFVAVPTKMHMEFIRHLLENDIHVFAEKPFCLTPEQGEPLVSIAKKKNLINQVGYHNKFIGTFKEVKRLIAENVIGDLLHFEGESYGPVVIKKQPESWRSNTSEGGGCLMDYASHVIDLVNDILSPVSKVYGSILKPLYSAKVEDAVYSLVELNNKLSGVISVNWSDETFRKMSTSLTIMGTKGKIISDANELKVYFNNSNTPAGYTKGWNVKYVTDLTKKVDFYLRGEEYSEQIDYFIESVLGNVPNTINTFASAWKTDNAINLIKKSAQ